MDIELLKNKMDEAHYVYDENLVTTLYVALALGRPLLIEGAAGAGKTEIAKVMASALDRPLIRLQCYEGLDESKTLYEWNYQKQLLAIQIKNGKEDDDKLTKSLFSDEYMLERPLLASIKSEEPVVLLIDEIDKADEAFEAFLLELLSDFQISVPEVGTIKAKSIPFVVLTSNRVRPISDALRRRCAYLYIEYPDIQKETAILRAKLPLVDERLCVQVAQAIHDLRNNEAILKKPSVAEALDWAEALHALGVRELTPELMKSTVGFVLKNNEDILTLEEELGSAQNGEACCGEDSGNGTETVNAAGSPASGQSSPEDDEDDRLFGTLKKHAPEGRPCHHGEAGKDCEYYSKGFCLKKEPCSHDSCNHGGCAHHHG